MQTILWSILWILVRWLLGVSKELITTTMEAVVEAQDLKHEDGTAYSGNEKKDYVLAKLEEKFKNLSTAPEWKSTINTVVELALGYLKGLQKV